MKIKIFLFHRISPQRDPLWDPISPENFEKIIRFISKNFAVVPLEQTILNSSSAPISTKPMAAIVFDDGYKDFTLYALPILEKYRCPCSMYVITDCVENQLPPWTYILDYHLTHSKKMELLLDINLLPEALAVTKFKDITARLQFAKQVKPYLKTVSNSVRTHLYNQILKSLDDVQPPSTLMMTWNEIKEIKHAGVEIGSHSETHPLLNKIEQESEIIAELRHSGEKIKKQLGTFPTTISYPIGGYNQLVKKLAIETGYKIGLAVNQTTYKSELHDHLEIPRIELYNEHVLKSRLRISGIISKVQNFLKK